MTLTTMLPLVAALLALGATALLVYGIYSAANAERRQVAERVMRQTEDEARTATAVAQSENSILVQKDFSTIDQFDKLLKRGGFAASIADDLARAGVPLRVGEYLLMRWLIAILLFLALTALGLNLAVGLIVGIIGFFVPRVWVGRREGQRIRKFEDQMVDALTMMANSMRSGSSFMQAMDLISKELPAPVSEEFGRVVAESSVGASVERGLNDMLTRVRSYDLYLMVTATLVQREVGGNLSEVFDKIAHTIRERQRLLRQVQVETAEQRLSGYILAVLPILLAVFMIVTRPDYLSVFVTTTLGQILLVLAIVMEIVGIIVINKMAKIEV